MNYTIMIDYRFEIAKEIALRDISVHYEYIPSVQITRFHLRKYKHNILFNVYDECLIDEYRNLAKTIEIIEYHFKRLAHV